MRKGTSFKKLYDIDDFVSAIRIASQKVGAEYDEVCMRKTLEVFKVPFEGGGTAYRTTTKQKRKINFRYYSWEVEHYPFDMAMENGLIENDGHPILRVIPYIVEHYPLMGDSSGFGIDAGAAYGLEKIWTFVEESVPLSELIAMPALPPSVKKNMEYFEKHKLDTVKVIGTDFRAKSMNLYFMAYETGGLPTEKVAALIGDLGFEVPNEEVLRHCSLALPIYFTFNWHSPNIQRVCFASCAPEPAMIPRWHPVMRLFAEEAPTIADKRLLFYNPTFVRGGNNYTKVEICYHLSFATDLLRLTPNSYMEEIQAKMKTATI